MGRALSAFVAIAVCGLWAATASAESSFRVVELVVDPGSAVLAAYQVEVAYDPAAVSLVGIEGGDPPFSAPPYYDPRGLTAGRVAIAAFSTEAGLAAGKVRVARLHLEDRTGEQSPVAVRVTAAGEPGGERIEARAWLVSFSSDAGGTR